MIQSGWRSQVNAVAEAYAQQNLDKRLQASRKCNRLVTGRRESLRDRIAEEERRIHTLKEDKRLLGTILVIPGGRLAELGCLKSVVPG